MWTSVWCILQKSFLLRQQDPSTMATQVGFPLCCQLLWFHCCKISTGHFSPFISRKNTDHFPCSAISKASWMAITSAYWLDSPSPLAVSETCLVGFHTAAFDFWCFPTIWQDPSVSRTYYFSFSGSFFYSGASSALFTSYSGDIPGQSMINSKIPEQLGFLFEPFLLSLRPSHST